MFLIPIKSSKQLIGLYASKSCLYNNFQLIITQIQQVCKQYQLALSKVSAEDQTVPELINTD